MGGILSPRGLVHLSSCRSVDFIPHVPTATRGPFGIWFIWHGSGGNAEAFDFLAERGIGA